LACVLHQFGIAELQRACVRFELNVIGVPTAYVSYLIYMIVYLDNTVKRSLLFARLCVREGLECEKKKKGKKKILDFWDWVNDSRQRGVPKIEYSIRIRSGTNFN